MRYLKKNFYQQLKLNRLFKIYFQILLCFCFSNTYSQNKDIKCDTIQCNTNYYKITVFKENQQPFFLNVVGKNIDFEIFSKDSLQGFLNDLFIKNTFSPILMDMKYYIDFCEVGIILKEDDLKIKYKFENLFEKKAKKVNREINLKSGEQIIIEGVNFKGISIIIENSELEYEKISLYPTEIYDCKTIKKYMIPLKIDCINKIKRRHYPKKCVKLKS